MNFLNTIRKKISLVLIEEISIIFLCTIITTWIFFFLSYNSFYIPHDHLVKQAKSFLEGTLFIKDPSIYLGDLALYKNNYYLFYGPLPSFILIPFVFLFKNLNQHLILIPIIPVSIYCLYKLNISLTASKLKSVYLTAGFYFGTFFFFLTSLNITAYTVQIIATCFIIISLYYFIYKKDIALSGIFFSLAILTRIIFIIGVIFFIYEIIFSKKPLKKRLNELVIFILPTILGLGIIFFYNYIRFGSIFDSGYDYNISDNQTLLFYSAKEYGFFSLAHIPGNIYYGFIKVFDPIFANSQNHVLKFPFFKADPSGHSIFLSSPFIFYALKTSFRDRYVFSSFVALVIILVINLTYFSSGTWTFGYRYALDFFPFLFIILATVFRHHFSIFARILIIFSIILNAFFMYSIWGVYPFLSPSLWP